MKIKSTQTLQFLLSVALSLVCVNQSWAEGGKGNLNGAELDYFYNTFTPILIKAHICTEVHKDCAGLHNFICNSNETLSCSVYGITDEKVIKELFMSMLNSGLNVSYFAFYRGKAYQDSMGFFHHGSFFEKPVLEFIDRTVK